MTSYTLPPIHDVDAAYLAGLVDGDGCILVRRRDKPTSAGDRKRNISFITLLKVGGEEKHLLAVRKTWHSLGTVWVRRKDGLRPLAEWTIAGNQAKAVLGRIELFLRLKRKQAVLAINMLGPRTRWGATPKVRRDQERCRLRISKLNTLGRGKVVAYGTRTA